MSEAFSLADFKRLEVAVKRKKETSSSPVIEPPGSVNEKMLGESTSPETKTTTSEPTQALAPFWPERSINSLTLKKKALDSFEDGLGGRTALIETLELANLNPKEEHLLNLLADPRRQRDTLTTIAKEAGLKIPQVLDLFRSASFAKAHALSLAKAASSLPDVVEDIASKSIDQKIECPTCFGRQQVAAGVQCPQCWGKGEIMRYSDLDHQKTLLEVAGMTKKGGGVNVQVNTQVNNNAPSNYFSRWVKDSDSAAYNVLDAEVTKSDEQP